MIYLLSRNFEQSCAMLCDQHLNEAVMDTGMAVSFYLWTYKSEDVAFDAAHYFNVVRAEAQVTSNIPRALYPLRSKKDLFDWVIKSPSNYSFLIQYLIKLTDEYEIRFLKPHKFALMIPTLPKEKYEQTVDRAQIERRVLWCSEIYSKPRSSWKWTNRDKPNYVL